MKPHIIGIAGPSSSGKTELASRVAARLPGTGIVSLDSYYRGMEEIPLEARKKCNFDHPDALEWELLHSQLEELAHGHTVQEPVYSFSDYARTAETRRIEAPRCLIVEGLFVLYWPALRDMLDTKVFVVTDPGECFRRRLRRDVLERGRTEASVRQQYERTVRPSAELYVLPTKNYAGLCVSGQAPFEESVGAVLAAVGAALPGRQIE
jgi:uridine kinase